MEQLTLQSGGVATHTLDDSGGATHTGPVASGAGTMGAPGQTFGIDLDTGWYRVAANTIGAAVGGVLRLLLGEAIYVRGTAPIPLCDLVTVTALADADATLTAAQHRGTICTVATGATNRTITTLTAALLVGAVPNAQVGTMLPLRMSNLKAANTVTIGLGSGVTAAVGANLVVAAQASAEFALVFTNVTAASEAVSLVRISG